MGHSRPLFFIFVLLQLVENLVYKTLPMIGFELRISGVRSNSFINWATTTVQASQTYVHQGPSGAKVLVIELLIGNHVWNSSRKSSFESYEPKLEISNKKAQGMKFDTILTRHRFLLTGWTFD